MKLLSEWYEIVSEGKFKSDAHRKAVHAGKASGKKKMKKLRDHSELKSRLAAKLEATKITPSNIKATKIKKQSIKPQTE